MGVARVLDTCEAFAVTTARQPGRPIRALFLSDGTVVPRTSSCRRSLTRRIGSSFTSGNRPPTLAPLGVVVDSTIAEPNDVFVDWWRTSPVGEPTMEEKLVLGPDGCLHRGPPMDKGGRCGSVMATTNHNPPHRRRQRDDDVDRRSVAAMSSATVARLPDRANEHHPRRGLGPAAAGRSVAKFVCGGARRVPCHATWLARDRPDPAVNLAVCPYCSRATCSRRPAP